MTMHKIGERYHDSIGKLLGYCCYLAKHDVAIRFENKYELHYKAPKSISISQTLFQTDSCQSSGKCCKVAFDLAYTEEGIERINKSVNSNQNARRLLDALKPVETEVNGKSVKIWVHLNDEIARYTGEKTCDFLEHPDSGEFAGRFICGIHGGYNRVFESAQPFHCIAPHFVVRTHTDGSSFVGRMQFGRNWRFGCPVVFERSLRYFEKDYTQDLDKLEIIRRIAEDIKIETWVPEIIDWLKNNREYIEKMIATGVYQNIEVSKLYRKETIDLF